MKSPKKKKETGLPGGEIAGIGLWLKSTGVRTHDHRTQ
jgi:hypothetical protein